MPDPTVSEVHLFFPEPFYWIWNLGSYHVKWARPITFATIGAFLALAIVHFVLRVRRERRLPFFGSKEVRVSSAPITWHIGPDVLLVYRFSVFLFSFWTLVDSSFVVGPGCFRFFTVWNFVALVVFFALGTGLSFSCCRDAGTLRPTPSAVHRLTAALHHLLLEVELPMAAMIAMVVWLVLYPYEEASLTDHTTYHDPNSLSKYTNLTSLTMHGANLLFMLIEFALDSLHVTPGHIGLVLAWGMLYALFNGLQVFWTNDTVYFFMDFTLAKTPFVAVALTLLMCLIFGLMCCLSIVKWRLLLGRNHPSNPHAGDCCGTDSNASIVWAAARAASIGGNGQPSSNGPLEEGGFLYPDSYSPPPGGRDEFGLDHPSIPYLQFSGTPPQSLQ